MPTKQNNLSFFINSYFGEIQRALQAIDPKDIETVVEIILNAHKKTKRIFMLGNGGSAAIASHFACDLGKGTLQRVYDFKEKRFQIVSLTDNVPIITAFANDVSFDEVFVQQLRNLLEKDDVVIVISGSGNSKNVIKAVQYAKVKKAKIIGFLGFKTGGKLKNLCDHTIIVDSVHYGPIEDIHSIFGHLISSWVSYAVHMNGKRKKIPYKNDIFLLK